MDRDQRSNRQDRRDSDIRSLGSRPPEKAIEGHDVDRHEPVNNGVDHEQLAALPDAMSKRQRCERQRNRQTSPARIAVPSQDQRAPEGDVGPEMFEERLEIFAGVSSSIDLTPDRENRGAGECSNRELDVAVDEDLALFN